MFIDTFIDSNDDTFNENIIETAKVNTLLKTLKLLKMKIIDTILQTQFEFLDLIENMDYIKINLDSFYISWINKNYKSPICNIIKNITKQFKLEKQNGISIILYFTQILNKFEKHMLIAFNHIFIHLIKFYIAKFATIKINEHNILNNNTTTNKINDKFTYKYNSTSNSKYKQILQTYNLIIKYCYYVEKECWKKQKCKLSNSDRMNLTLKKALSTCYLWIYPNLELNDIIYINNINLDNRYTIIDNKYTTFDNNSIINNIQDIWKYKMKNIEWFTIHTQLLDDIHDIDEDLNDGITTSCLNIYELNQYNLMEQKLNGLNLLLCDIDKYLHYIHNNYNMYDIMCDIMCDNNINNEIFTCDINVKYCIKSYMHFVIYSILPIINLIKNKKHNLITNKNNANIEQNIDKYLKCCIFNINYIEKIKNIKNNNKHKLLDLI
jgi:hypothetical protein